MVRRDDFLRSQKILHIGTADADGTPHVVPVWYRYASGRFHVGTNTRTRKARNVARTGRASICVDTGVNAPGIYGVAGSGDAAVIRDAARVRRIGKKILSRYFDSIDDESARDLLDDTDCIIEIVPDKLVTWSF